MTFSFFRIFSALALISAVTPGPAWATDPIVAISIAKDTPITGTGTGRDKDAAMKAARAACSKAAGRPCSYAYWTKSSSVMVMMYCDLVAGGEQATGGLAGHHKTSLAKAEQSARRDLQARLLRNTYSHLKHDDCHVVASYSDGRFHQN